jgi:hypothetical protein
MDSTSEKQKIGYNVAVAMTTMYDMNSPVGQVRANLALQTIRGFRDLGAKVYVVDGNSSSEFVDHLKSAGIHVYQEKISEGKHPMGRSRRQALELACEEGRKIVLWTEPEKNCIPSQLYKLVEPVLNNSVDIVIPDRRPLSTYPISQQYAENFGNSYWKEITNTDLDMWGGVRVIANNTDAMSNFLNYKGEYGDLWDGAYVPVIQTIVEQGKTRVMGIKIDYVHPEKQRRIEEGNPDFTNKRLSQLNNLFPAIKKSWKYFNKRS